MIHTLELSKVMSKATFEEIIRYLHLPYYKCCWLTTNYAECGLTMIRLYKFKRSEFKNKSVPEDDLTHYYMIAIVVNTGCMFGGDSHLSNNLLAFTPDFITAIYHKIFETIPCLEQGKQHYNDNPLERSLWFEINAFKARRLDVTFEIKIMHQQYLTLINRGYMLPKKYYKLNEYSDNTQTVLPDDEPDIIDFEELMDDYNSDIDSMYYKGSKNGLNINIYHKETELKKRGLLNHPDIDYDFLRIEVQMKKGKLNSLVSKYDLRGRELQYLIIPEVEEYVLDYYVTRLTGKGVYVTLKTAKDIINSSGYTKAKKDKLIRVIQAVSDKHGIAKVLEQVENGTITDLGKLSTVKQYLREIHNIGINPVTISARMNVPKVPLINLSGGADRSEIALPSLVDIIKTYSEQTKYDRQHGIPVTEEDLKQIDKL